MDREIGRETRSLTVTLGADEIAAEADRGARFAKMIRDEREALAEDVKARKREIASLEIELREALECVRTGRREQPIEVLLVLRAGSRRRAAEVEIVRGDTGEIIGRRPPTDRERQLPMPLGGEQRREGEGHE